MTDPGGLTTLVGRGRATLAELFQARARLTPDARFLRWEHSAWTYAEAWAEIRRFAGWASQATGGGEARLASFLGNRPETVWTWLGSLAGGVVYVPLNRSHRGDLLYDMLARSGATVLVTDREGRALLPDLAGTAIQRVLVVDDPSDGWSAVLAAAPYEGAPPAPDDLAQLMYTSGTTGRSKAVMLSHNQICRGGGWLAEAFAMTSDDVVHGWLPLFHIGGQVDIVAIAIVSGAEVALFPRFSLSRFWAEVEAVGATVFAGFSNVIELLWSLPERPGDRGCSLRAGIVGGIPAELHLPFEERFGVTLYESYGMTEAEPLALPDPGAPVGSVGRPSPDFELAVLDEADAPVAEGAVGEICFRPRRPGVMLMGYEGDEAATASSWFHTGDLGRFDADGYLYFVDRKKHSIRRRGENISSWELERMVAKHPGVHECAVVGVPSPLGEQDVKLAVSQVPGATLDPGDLHRWCAERMAAFMVPRYIDVLDELPRMPTGKVRKIELGDVTPRTWDADASKPPSRGVASAQSQVHATVGSRPAETTKE